MCFLNKSVKKKYSKKHKIEINKAKMMKSSMIPEVTRRGVPRSYRGIH